MDRAQRHRLAVLLAALGGRRRADIDHPAAAPHPREQRRLLAAIPVDAEEEVRERDDQRVDPRFVEPVVVTPEARHADPFARGQLVPRAIAAGIEIAAGMRRSGNGSAVRHEQRDADDQGNRDDRQNEIALHAATSRA